MSISTQDTQENIETEIEELVDFEGYLNRLVGEAADIFSDDNDQSGEAIQKLNELVGQEFPVGPDGSNATESLKGIIDDNELYDIFKELADVSPESDVRPILKDYIKIKDEENGTDVLSKVNFPEGGQEEPAAEPAAEPAPEAPAPTPEPAAATPAPAAPPSLPMSPGVAMAENIKNVIERAKKAGMTAEDTFTLFGEEITLGDAIQRAGLDLNEFFGDGYKDSGDEVVEFVRSMFDENGNTPKGPTGVLISVEKKFGEEALGKAKHVMNELMNQAEMRRIQELSGISSEGFGDDLAFGAGKFAGDVANFADKKIQGYKNLGNKVVQKATQFGSNIAQGANDVVDAAKAGYQRSRGQAAQPEAPQPNPKGGKMLRPTAPGQSTTSGTVAQKENSELAAMLRIAGIK